jgi:AraC-like DNA-binding protein
VWEDVLTTADVTSFRISTGAFSLPDRTEGFRETWGRTMLQLEIEPLAKGEQIDIDMAFSVFSTLRVAHGRVSPVRCRHLAKLADNDDLIFTMVRSGAVSWDRGDREANVSAGEAILTASGETATYVGYTPAQLLNFRFSRQKLADRLSDAEDALIRAVPKDNPALRLLNSYVGMLGDEQTLATPSLRLAVDDHLHDLIALALGATRDAGELAKGRGVRFARLRAIQADIAANVASRDLSVDVLAARHGISPRYIRALFKDRGTTFTDFVRDLRLARAHRLLVDPQRFERAVGAIAYDAGFGDLSYFNHAFRRRYGATPSDIRAAAREDCGV